MSNYPYPLLRFIMIEFTGGNFASKLVHRFYKDQGMRTNTKIRFFQKTARWKETFPLVQEELGLESDDEPARKDAPREPAL